MLQRPIALLLGSGASDQLRSWTQRQWHVAAWAYVAALLLVGTVGETLPGVSSGRDTPVEWWNYVTLAMSPPLIALIVASFVGEARSRSGRRQATGAGVSGVLGTVAMACPLCNPLAIPLFGAAGVLSFLGPARGAVALLSTLLLFITLRMRVRTGRTCRLAPSSVAAEPVSGKATSKGAV
jgi:uncharacterized membrane protein